MPAPLFTIKAGKINGTNLLQQKAEMRKLFKQVLRAVFSASLQTALLTKGGGVVYGVAYEHNDLDVSFVRVDCSADIKRCQGSKYVQSGVIDYAGILNDLHNGKTVLVSGCPCQIDALQKYLISKKADLAKLVTCDLVCHGVPSPKVWTDFVHWLEKQNRQKLNDFAFRYKSDKCRWGTVNTAAFFEKKTLVSTKYTNSFIKLYFKNLITRPDCGACPYTSLARTADLTLADCWGIENVDKTFNDMNGVSLVKINSDKGKRLMEDINRLIDTLEVDISKLNQPHLYSPCVPAENRAAFWADYNAFGYARAAKKYAIENTWQKSKRVAKEYLSAVKKRLR